jgi:hypothetical protein
MAMTSRLELVFFWKVLEKEKCFHGHASTASTIIAKIKAKARMWSNARSKFLCNIIPEE